MPRKKNIFKNEKKKKHNERKRVGGVVGRQEISRTFWKM